MTIYLDSNVHSGARQDLRFSIALFLGGNKTSGLWARIKGWQQQQEIQCIITTWIPTCCSKVYFLSEFFQSDFFQNDQKIQCIITTWIPTCCGILKIQQPFSALYASYAMVFNICAMQYSETPQYNII